jgi:hypothetical protein
MVRNFLTLLFALSGVLQMVNVLKATELYIKMIKMVIFFLIGLELRAWYLLGRHSTT